MADKFLGVDVSKDRFHVALFCGGKYRQKSFDNNPLGFARLRRWLKAQHASEAHICMEATGNYGLDLATFLYENGLLVSVANPARIAAFIKSELGRTKTDKADARAIARFCRASNPPPWLPPSPQRALLRDLSRRLDDLKDAQAQEKNRLKDPGLSPSVRRSIQRHLDFLKEEIQAVEKELKDLIRHDQELKKQNELLQSIPSIGPATAHVLMSEYGDFSQFENARQVAAYAGLVPAARKSGSSVGGRTPLSKTGNARIRKALYWPAITAIRCNPIIQDFARRMRQNGKKEMEIIGGAMRHLLHLAFGVIKTQLPFDPTYRPTRG